MLSPAWSAAIVQVPAIMAYIVLVLTLQTLGVAELKVTASPEVAVALAAVVPLTTRLLGVKVIAPIVWSCLSDIVISSKTGVEDVSLVDNSTLYWIHSLFVLNTLPPLLEQPDQAGVVSLEKPLDATAVRVLTQTVVLVTAGAVQAMFFHATPAPPSKGEDVNDPLVLYVMGEERSVTDMLSYVKVSN